MCILSYVYLILCVICASASFPNAFNVQTAAAQLQQAAATNSPAGKQTEGKATKS